MHQFLLTWAAKHQRCSSSPLAVGNRFQPSPHTERPTPPPPSDTAPTSWSPTPTPSGLRAVLLSTVGTASCSHMFSTKLAPTVAKRRHPRPHQNATLKYAAPGSIKAFQITDDFLVKADSVTLTPLCRDEVGRQIETCFFFFSFLARSLGVCVACLCVCVFSQGLPATTHCCEVFVGPWSKGRQNPFTVP